MNVTAELSTAAEKSIYPEASIDCHAHSKHRKSYTQTNGKIKGHSDILSTVASLEGKERERKREREREKGESTSDLKIIKIKQK